MVRNLGFAVAFVLTMAFLLGISSAAVLDVSVGTDDVVYNTNENVTVSGVVRYLTTGKPVSLANVVVSVDSGSLHSGSYSTNSDGKFQTNPFSSGSTEGTKTISVTATKTSSAGGVTGSFAVESKKSYVIKTDKFTYSPNELVNARRIMRTGRSHGLSITRPRASRLPTPR